MRGTVLLVDLSARRLRRSSSTGVASRSRGATPDPPDRTTRPVDLVFRRLRSLLTLCALALLVPSLAAGMWAAASGTAWLRAGAVAGTTHRHAADCDGVGVDGCAEQAHGGSDGSPGDGTLPCPLMPTGAFGTCGAFAALPSPSGMATSRGAARVRVTASGDAVPELLLVDEFFRPPNA